MKFVKKTAVSTAAIISMTLMAGAAHAANKTAGDIFSDLASQVSEAGTFVSVIAFVIGVAIAIMGLLKFKANSDNPNDPSNKKSTAFVLVFVGAGLVAIPAVLGSGISTIFGDSATTTDATTGFQSLN